MASLKDCIKAALQQGEITHDQAQALYDRYDQLARLILSPAAVRAQLSEELAAEALERKRRTLLTETKRQDIDVALFGHKNRKGEYDPGEALQFLIEPHGQAK